MTSDTCPDSLQLERLLSGAIDGAEEAGLVAHIEHCDHCQAQLEAMTQGQGLRGEFEKPQAERSGSSSVHSTSPQACEDDRWTDVGTGGQANRPAPSTDDLPAAPEAETTDMGSGPIAV